MIVKKLIMTLILSICLTKAAPGTSYSTVFVESATSPRRYYQYESPYRYASIANPKYAQINTLPASASTYVNPCQPPCILSGQALTALNPASNVLTYNSPYATIPVVVGSTKEEPTGYQYSYVVYDENTGDHKAQSELSDGSVVRGEYSFIQPDGYIREVQYIADDIKGFNAVVKNFLPAALESKSNTKKEVSEPCHDVTRESLKEASGEEQAKDHDIESQDDRELDNQLKHDLKNPLEPNNNAELSKVPEHKNDSASGYYDNKHNESEHSPETVQEHIDEHIQDTEHSYKNELDHGNENSLEKNHEHENQLEHSQEGSKEPSIETPSESIISSSEKSGEPYSEKPEMKPKNGLSEEVNSTHTEENIKNPKEISIESDSADDSKETIIVHPTYQEVLELIRPTQKGVESYQDIFRCIQTALKKSLANSAALREEPSPLTYIVLKKSC